MCVCVQLGEAMRDERLDCRCIEMLRDHLQWDGDRHVEDPQ